MGLIGTVDGHEGYLRGYVAPDPAWPAFLRELGQEHGRDAAPRVPIEWIAMACECGWRSPRWRARLSWSEPERGRPHRTEHPHWVPSVVIVSPVDEGIGAALFLEHDRAMRADPLERARRLAEAQVYGPSAGTWIVWWDPKREASRRGHVLNSSIARDRDGNNTRIQVEEGPPIWIDSMQITELL